MRRVLGTVAYLGGLPAVLEEFCWAWGQLVQYNAEYVCQPGEQIHYERARASFHSFARNSLAENFLGDWLLMLDTDHAFEPDLCARLLVKLNAYDAAGVLTALYVHKVAPHSPVVYQYDERKGMQPIAEWDPRAEAFQVGSAGAGALLIRRAVFDRIRVELKEPPFDVTVPYGEDHSFFLRCRKLGIKTFAVPAIESPHLIVKPLHLADHDTRGVRIPKGQRTEVDAYG